MDVKNFPQNKKIDNKKLEEVINIIYLLYK